MLGLAGALEEVFEFLYEFISTLYDSPMAILYVSVIGLMIGLAAKRAVIT